MEALQKSLDGVGFSASFACAIHCAVMPLALAALPALGLSWLASPIFGKGMLVFTGVVATSAIWMGFRKHNRCWPIGFLGIGLALLFLSEFVLHSMHVNINPSWARLYPNSPVVKQAQQAQYISYSVSFAGGLFVAISHILNHYFHRTCHVESACASGCCHAGDTV